MEILFCLMKIMHKLKTVCISNKIKANTHIKKPKYKLKLCIWVIFLTLELYIASKAMKSQMDL